MNNNLKPAFVVEKSKKSSEEKEFIVLYYMYNEKGDEEQLFEICTGRTSMYEYIKLIIDNIDVDKSKVLSETATYQNALSVYEFMAFASRALDDKDFDITEYKTKE